MLKIGSKAIKKQDFFAANIFRKSFQFRL